MVEINKRGRVHKRYYPETTSTIPTCRLFHGSIGTLGGLFKVTDDWSLVECKNCLRLK